MRILHLIYDDIDNPWLGGGGAIRTHEIYKRLAKKHEITVITGNYPNAKREEIKEGIFYKRVGSNRNYFLSRLSYSLSVPQLVRKLDHDILIEDFSAHSPCFAPLYTKKPVIACIQNLFGTHAIRAHKLLGLFVLGFENIGLRLYKNFISVSPYVKEKLQNKILKGIERKIVVIPNGVEEYLFSSNSSEEDYILFLGRIDIYQKGIDILLKAFQKVTKEDKSVRLVIAGGGADDKKLRELISRSNLKDKIDYLGRVSSKIKKKELLSNCLFVCIPSRFETWPLVPFEAAACGKPVIASRIPGNWDTVKDGETGILVESGKIEALSRAMIEFIKNVKLRTKLGKNAKAWVKSFSWDKVAEMQESFFISIK